MCGYQKFLLIFRMQELYYFLDRFYYFVCSHNTFKKGTSFSLSDVQWYFQLWRHWYYEATQLNKCLIHSVKHWYLFHLEISDFYRHHCNNIFILQNKHKINHKNSSKPGLFLKVNVIIGHKEFVVKKTSCSVLPRYLKLG